MNPHHPSHPPFGQYDLQPEGGTLISPAELLSSVASAETVHRHDFGRPPDYLAMRFLCVASNNNWSPGESWLLTQQNAVAQGVVLAGLADKVLAAWQGSSGANVTCPDRSVGGGSGGLITTSSWKFQIIAHWFARF